MDLVERLFAELETKDLNCVLLGLQKDIEEKLGYSLSEDITPNIYDELEKDDTIWGIEQFRQYANLYSVLVALGCYEHEVLDFFENAKVGCQSYELEALEAQLSEEQSKVLDDWIDKINQIKDKRQLFILKKEGNLWFVDWSCELYDYENGTVTRTDMEVRKEIMNRLNEEFRIKIVLDKGCSIEI
jgi:hypothetical protein